MAHEKIIGIGVDIEQISRFREKPFNNNERLYRKLFTQQEIDYCILRRNSYRHFTARFCAKEALAKTLPIEKLPAWTEVEIRSDENGRPYFHFSLSDKTKQAYLDNLTFHLSLSHDRSQAIASVIVTKK